jgi:hypothetical protein
MAMNKIQVKFSKGYDSTVMKRYNHESESEQFLGMATAFSR